MEFVGMIIQVKVYRIMVFIFLLDQYNRTRASKILMRPIGFLTCHFITIFIQKLAEMLIWPCFLEYRLALQKNEKCCSIFYSKNKNNYKFYTIKTDLKNMSKKRVQTEKQSKIGSRKLTLAVFLQFQQSAVFFEKW